MKNSNTTPYISVIIPIFNREKTIKRCVDSVLQSTLKEIEVILVDDGSTDKSYEIMQELSKFDYRIKLLHFDNHGVSFARNRGLDIAKGKYISFIDSDDYIDNQIYKTCFNIIKQNQPDLIHFNYYVQLENGNSYPQKNNTLKKHTLLDKNYITQRVLSTLVNANENTEDFISNFIWDKIFKRSIIETNNIRFDETRARWEDRTFVINFLYHSKTFYDIPDCGYHYVMGNSSFSKKFDNQLFDIIAQNIEYNKNTFGHLYNFNKPFTISYYCNTINKTALYLLTLDASKNDFLELFHKLLNCKIIREHFKKFIPKTKFDKKIKNIFEKGTEFDLYKAYCLENKKQMRKNRRISITVLLRKIFSLIKKVL